MRVLVAGNSGQVAKSMTECADDTSHTVAALGRPQLDITDRDSVEAAFNEFSPGVLVNAAAYTAVDKAEGEAEAAMQINAVGAQYLAEVSAKHNCPIIHISTDYVFDGTSSAPYSESTPVAPLGVYGTSKLRGERAVAAANEKHIILRTAWVYSPFGGNFIKTMLRIAEDRYEISVVSDQSGSPTYAPDIANGIYAIIDFISARQSSDVSWGTYHMAGSGNATWADVAETALVHSASIGGPFARINRISTEEYPTPAARPKNSRLNCDLLEETFNIRLPEWSNQVRACVERLLA